MSKIQRGAVAMIDALGVRGIWGKDSTKPSLDAFATFNAVRAALEPDAARFRKLTRPNRFPQEYRRLVEKPRVDILFLSDTLVIAASVAPHSHSRSSKRSLAVDGFMRYIVCHCVCTAIRAAALARKTIAYRGVVSVGHFSIEKNFILGPAVDEAAGLMDVADAAVVWLSPGAGRLPHVLYPRQANLWPQMIIGADIPLKDGRSLRANAVNPFTLATPAETKQMKKNLLGSMGIDHIDVVVKRQNTRRFFKAIDARAEMIALRRKYAEKRRSKLPSGTTEERPDIDTARRGAGSKPV